MNIKNITQKRCTCSATDYNWVQRMAPVKKHICLLMQGLITITMLWSCCNKIDTPADYKYIQDFHKTTSAKVDILQQDAMSLYVDYSICMAMGQNSRFYNALTPSIVDATKSYYAIRGNDIGKEDGSVFQLLRTIEEVNYADLQTVIMRMAESNSESMLLTDCEFYEPTISKGHINDPYMASAMKKWLLKGHDIYILSEPYIEPYNGGQYNKKRFYIMFTDSRLPGNIWNRISQTVKLDQFPDVEQFHLSVDHPSLYVSSNMNHSEVNQSLAANVKGFGNYETQEWTVSWDVIEQCVMGACDEQTGKPLVNGDFISKGIKIDRNCFGGFRISDVDVKAYNINQAYSDFYTSKENKAKNAVDPSTFVPIDGFMKDKKEFDSHGMIDLHFDLNSFAPQILDGKPFNYIRIDLNVGKIEPLIDNFAEMFYFDSIDKPGETNTSLAESIKQCMFAPEIQEHAKSCSIYTYYIQSNKY